MLQRPSIVRTSHLVQPPGIRQGLPPANRGLARATSCSHSKGSDLLVLLESSDVCHSLVEAIVSLSSWKLNGFRGRQLYRPGPQRCLPRRPSWIPHRWNANIKQGRPWDSHHLSTVVQLQSVPTFSPSILHRLLPRWFGAVQVPVARRRHFGGKKGRCVIVIVRQPCHLSKARDRAWHERDRDDIGDAEDVWQTTEEEVVWENEQRHRRNGRPRSIGSLAGVPLMPRTRVSPQFIHSPS